METLIAGLAERGVEKAAENGAELLINGIHAALSNISGNGIGRGETVSGRVHPVSAQRAGALQSVQDDGDRTRPTPFWGRRAFMSKSARRNGNARKAPSRGAIRFSRPSSWTGTSSTKSARFRQTPCLTRRVGRVEAIIYLYWARALRKWLDEFDRERAGADSRQFFEDFWHPRFAAFLDVSPLLSGCAIPVQKRLKQNK